MPAPITEAESLPLWNVTAPMERYMTQKLLLQCEIQKIKRFCLYQNHKTYKVSNEVLLPKPFSLQVISIFISLINLLKKALIVQSEFEGKKMICYLTPNYHLPLKRY